MFGPRVGFLKFRSTAKVNAGGEKGVITVPGIVFMRGGAVGVLVILECDGKEYTLLTNQARVPIGHHALPEIPAGSECSNGRTGLLPTTDKPSAAANSAGRLGALQGVFLAKHNTPPYPLAKARSFCFARVRAETRAKTER